jgi:hypothetical protein
MYDISVVRRQEYEGKGMRGEGIVDTLELLIITDGRCWMRRADTRYRT